MIIAPSDVHTAASSFIGVMLAEAVVKPVAAKAGRYLIRKLDESLNGLIPDWLWDISKRPGNK